MNFSPKDRQSFIMKRLSAFGLEKTVLRSLCPLKKEDTDFYHNAYKPIAHRSGGSWINSEYHSHMADRIVRVYESVVGDITKAVSIRPRELHDVTVAYLALYPRDDMSINRIYHLIKNIQSGIVAVEKSCDECGKPYVIAPSMSRFCSACGTIGIKKPERREKACRSIRRYSKTESNLRLSSND
jgi:hypothetical protein